MESIRGSDEVQIVQTTTQTIVQTAAQPAMAEVEAVRGTPGLVAVSDITARWNDMLRLLGEREPTAPAVVGQFRVVRVDGNVVVIGANSEIYVNRLKVPQKVKLVEWALSNIHRVHLRVDIVLASADSTGASSSDEGDSLLDEARKLGAEIHPFEERRKE
jgi:hypothetical protein